MACLVCGRIAGAAVEPRGQLYAGLSGPVGAPPDAPPRGPMQIERSGVCENLLRRKG